MTGFSGGGAEARAPKPRAGGGSFYPDRGGGGDERRGSAHNGVDSGNLVLRIAELVERQRLHVKLDIGALARGVGAGEQPELRGGHGERTAAEQRIVEHHAGAADT